MAAYWQDFRNYCVPADASRFQVLDTQAAFYCGAQALFWLLIDIDPEQLTPEEFSARMNEITNELKTYFDPKVAAAVLEALNNVVH